jgi:hypothetical protein
MPKGNPNPSPATRFGAEGSNPSRAKQKGSRERLSKDFLAALSNDFAKHSAAVIATVRRKDPST